VIFAEALTLGRHNGQTMLMARLANARHSSVSEATAEIWLLYAQDTPEGLRFVRFKPLALTQRRNPIFAFSWTLFHPVDENSPLHGLGPAEFEAMDAHFMVIFDGLDAVAGQRLNVRKGYTFADVRFGHVYSDILSPGEEDGPPQLDYGKIHDTEPQEEDG
jgi:inward rectifier potassium channel